MPLCRFAVSLAIAFTMAGCVEGFEFEDLVGPPPGPDACDECVRDAQRPDGSTDAESFNACVRDVPQCSLCLQPFFEAEDDGANGEELEVLFCDCTTTCAVP